MNAKEACEIYKENSDETRQLRDIIKRIESYARNGYTSMTYSDYLYNDGTCFSSQVPNFKGKNREKLEKLGYKIKEWTSPAKRVVYKAERTVVKNALKIFRMIVRKEKTDVVMIPKEVEMTLNHMSIEWCCGEEE